MKDYDGAAFRSEIKDLNAKQTNRRLVDVVDIIQDLPVDVEVMRELRKAIDRYVEAAIHEANIKRAYGGR